MDNNTIDTITNVIESEVNNKLQSEWKDIRIYFEHRRSPKEYRDRLRFIFCVLLIFALMTFLFVILSVSYLSSHSIF